MVNFDLSAMTFFRNLFLLSALFGAVVCTSFAPVSYAIELEKAAVVQDLNHEQDTCPEAFRQNAQPENRWIKAWAKLAPVLYHHEVFRLALSLRYRVRIHGKELLNQRDNTHTVMLSDHPAFVDPAVMTTTFRRWLNPRVLAKAQAATTPGIQQAMAATRPFVIPTHIGEEGQNLREIVRAVNSTFKEAATAVEEGDNLLIYPSGELKRSQYTEIGSNGAVEKILKLAPNARVLLFRIEGLYGSSFSFAEVPMDGLPDYPKAAKNAIMGLLRSGIFFSPRVPVDIYIREISREELLSKGREGMNQFLEEFWNTDVPPPRRVVRDWFEWIRNGFNRWVVLPERPVG